MVAYRSRQGQEKRVPPSRTRCYSFQAKVLMMKKWSGKVERGECGREAGAVVFCCSSPRASPLFFYGRLSVTVLTLYVQ